MRKSVIPLLTAALLVTPAISARADDLIHKCKNRQGDLIYQKSPCAPNVQTLSTWTQTIKVDQPEPEQKPAPTLVIKQHSSGHYFVDGEINGKPLTFVIDTGASVVALPDSSALAADINCKDETVVETANGTSKACTAIIPELKFGNFLIKNAVAMIAPNLSQPLLGMNILQHFKIAQDRGEMRISARERP